MGLVALAHQYRHPDGSIGASGKPDPKQVLVGGELWVLESRNASRPD